jgi:hypothetical protein
MVVNYLYEPVIERASMPRSPDEADHALRVRLRGAPATLKAEVERARAARGLRPLWPASAGRQRAQPPAPRKPAQRAAHVLCGVVAPHVSDPVAVTGEASRVREWFDPACWSRALDRVKQGRHVELLDRHGGIPVATTANGSLRLDVDRRLGLTLVAELLDTTTSRRLLDQHKKYGVPLSIGFASLKSEQRRLLGREVRAVLDLALDHVAAVGDGLKPAYPGANAVFASSAAPADVRAALDEAKRRAYLRLAG